MTSEALKPHLPFHSAEVSQGYFVRTGYFHADVPVSAFNRYSGVDHLDFRNGTAAFVHRMAALAGLQPAEIAFNTLSVVSNSLLQLRGEQLGLPVVLRTVVRFCPQCFREDSERQVDAGSGAQRLKWAWLMRPVVICRHHRMILVELPAIDPVRAFDVQKLIVEQDFKLPNAAEDGTIDPGPLQTYVEDRLWGTKDAASWLDGQGIAAASKSCEMLGALIDAGPAAQIGRYSAMDWAHAGDVGFRICSSGPDAIRDVLGELRISAGRSSGRAGPQAAYGFLYNWLKYTQRSEEFGPMRAVVRDAILDNFSIDPGEVVLGEAVTQRRVHSVNSLANTTGINRFSLYRVIRKAGMIPETTETAEFNQWVFPAAEGERLVARIQNSVRSNQLQHVLGCSKTHAELLVQQGLITSVVPSAEGQVGLTRGYFNHHDLSAFMAKVLGDAVFIAEEEEGYVDMTAAARPLTSAVEILQWHMDRKLTGTRLLKGVHRLDHLRFESAAVKALVKARRGLDLHSINSVGKIMGILPYAVRKLIAHCDGGPWLTQAPKELCGGLYGDAYVCLAEIKRFQAEYASIAMISRTINIHHAMVRRLLEQKSIQPAFDASWLGTRVYRLSDVASFIAEQRASHDDKQHLENHPIFNPKSEDYAGKGLFGESDDALL